ncbi:uncharacterized protein [Hemitrygon akajei]|uniref:uncharacterized protein n=1 Tax=Hemitrygon akajei TaxID=2704970 RepID=UPI003BF980C2
MYQMPMRSSTACSHVTLIGGYTQPKADLQPSGGRNSLTSPFMEACLHSFIRDGCTRWQEDSRRFIPRAEMWGHNSNVVGGKQHMEMTEVDVLFNRVMEMRPLPTTPVSIAVLCCLALLSTPSSARPRRFSPELTEEPCYFRDQTGVASPEDEGAGLQLRTAGRQWILARSAVGREAGAAAVLLDRALDDEADPCTDVLGPRRFDEEVLASLVTGLESYRKHGGFRFRFGK